MKRFYKQAAAVARDGGHTVELDGRPVRTPRRAALLVPAAAVAEAIAAEWLAQTDEIVPDSMPMLRLANTAIDIVGIEREAVIDNLAGFGRTDLLCYFAEAPADLVARQEELWRPLLAWAERSLGAALAATTGIGFVSQDEAAIERLRARIAALDDFELAALNDLVTISGSLVIGLAAALGELDGEAAWTAARVDEDHQAARWGLDHEAAERAEKLRRDFDDAMRFLRLHRGGEAGGPAG